MEGAQTQALGSCSAERLGWEEELLKEAEELPVRKEGNQESTSFSSEPGEGCCDERALSQAAHESRNKTRK